ncbi:hypothetical protein GDO86_020525 [Hymenochirus boettgeri]|uniref:G-protein coupled receptors family 1 profile domain-containing protein n=1 Tax=Hymenochirus boettgeri TaxID=247094 RepID=A0A8T2II66_9PIPI|nr:hypothetical protein GDO86_020525 [Hymenochirus boettgeri]
MEIAFNTSTSFVLLGIVEMEKLKVLFIPLSLTIYLLVLLFNTTIIYVVLLDESLHRPMYTLIAFLLLNGMFESSTIFPKLVVDLLLSSEAISRVGCFAQTFFVTLFAYCEISTFTIMAYDMYVAVFHPLQYPTLITNSLALKLISGSLVFNISLILSGLFLSASIPICGSHVKNVFCDNMSILNLSCVDSSVSRLYGMVHFTIYLIFTVIVITYSYMRILQICLKVSEDACRKAIHTLVTHLLNFSFFLITVLFIFIRYRLADTNLPLVCHIILSIAGLVLPPLLSPLVYGIRTQTLKRKVVKRLQIIKCVIHF